MYNKSDIGERMTGNYDYFMGLDVSPYIGNWVAICDEKVVAHSKSFKEVNAEAKEKCGRSKPFIAMVPTDETMIL